MTIGSIMCIILFAFADVAHLVERHLAKVEVASSSLVIRSIYAPVAQLDRVSGYEPEGQGFESLPARQKIQVFGLGFFYPLRKQWHIINDSVAIVVSHQSVRTAYYHAKRE